MLIEGEKCSYIVTNDSYRFLRSFFARTIHWNNWDPFLAQKVKAFQQSESSIFRRSIDVIP
jgi:hypothetical protein